MSKRMLIDATQNEEVRVAVVDKERLEEYEVETSARKQIKGNIYLAKVVRIEPSLQAAFVDYGDDRHGFLPFNEIHPDYYRIPISDRKKLEEAFKASRAAEEMLNDEVVHVDDEEALELASEEAATKTKGRGRGKGRTKKQAKASEEETPPASPEKAESQESTSTEAPEAVSAESLYSQYKIQEVIKRRQILLVQVVKEKRGNKGAALSTYLSLAGRYCVLMPNAGHRSGGISRKISDIKDRKRLRKVLQELNLPEEMGLIVRTAGSQRSKVEIKRDYDYLLRLWNEIREKTLQSIAPDSIHEEGDLVKRAIRDVYDRDVEEVLVDGAEAYKLAKSFMKMLIPSHAKRVKQYKDEGTSLFHKHSVDAQIDDMMDPTVPLPSGGSIVINTTEALVAIDVNSGKATRERNIDETAYKTNMEAAAEIARQVRLRDLAGIVVVDFIDMGSSKHIQAVERKFKEAIRLDRARIQVDRISQFGLLAFSRQRLRPSLFETHNVPCKHCQGTGSVRTIESIALTILRAIESEAVGSKEKVLTVSVAPEVDYYILNQKRQALQTIESNTGISVHIVRDDSLVAPEFLVGSVKKEPAKPKAKPRAQPQKRSSDSSQKTPRQTSKSTDGEEEKRPRRGRSHLRRDRSRQRQKPDTQQKPEAPEKPEVKAKPETKAKPEAPAGDGAKKENKPREGGSRYPGRRRRRSRGPRRDSQSEGSNTGSEQSQPEPSERKAAAPNLSVVESVPSEPRKEQPSAGTQGGSRKGWWQRLLES